MVVIFQTIFITLQETIIPSAAIPNFKHITKLSDNDFFDPFIKQGISFDDELVPLGRMEKTKITYSVQRR